MKKTLLQEISWIGCVLLMTALPTLAQEHKWAGRTLEGLEWRVHEELVMLPFHGVFDTLRFELQGKTVTLSGQVVRETVKLNAERVIKRLDGVESVINQIEVLPSSRRDDAIRMNVYRVIYEKQQLEKYGTRAVPPIHIIVKDGNVTLEGVVDSETDRKMAYLRALKVAPHVANNLRVAPED
ncbi:MAG TPA: BON domain-containing protein [Bryobacteraceae bacterium]|nr:BON domain-containing protein [Bryobacteraceae bacterium]HXJ40435.1 BON domain-containing protein [Bryobacteraceae bacterium]